MEPKQYAALLSEDIRQNNGFLVELTIRELLISEESDATEKEVIRYIKRLIKKTFHEIGAVRQEEDVNNIIDDLKKLYDILDITPNQVTDHIKSYLQTRSGDKPANYAGDPGKVSKYIIGRSGAEKRAASQARRDRRDDRLDGIMGIPSQ